MFKTHRTFDLSTGLKGTTIAVVNDGARLDVIYHKTCVVSKRGKTITLRNGGWDTVSTRIVISQALSEMRAGVWIERYKGETVLCSRRDNEGHYDKAPFVSGMRIKVAS